MEAIGSLFCYTWLIATVVFISTFVKRTRIAAAKRGFRYRRVRWATGITAACAFLAMVMVMPEPSTQQQPTPVAAAVAPAVEQAPTAPVIASTPEGQATEAQTGTTTYEFSEGQLSAAKDIFCQQVDAVAGDVLSGQNDGDADAMLIRIVGDAMDKTQHKLHLSLQDTNALQKQMFAENPGIEAARSVRALLLACRNQADGEQ